MPIDGETIGGMDSHWIVQSFNVFIGHRTVCICGVMRTVVFVRRLLREINMILVKVRVTVVTTSCSPCTLRRKS